MRKLRTERCKREERRHAYEKKGHLGVRLGVAQQILEEAARLLGPASLCVLVLLHLRLAADAGGEVAKGNDVLVRNDIVHVLLRLLETHALDGVGRLHSVLRRRRERKLAGA